MKKSLKQFVSFAIVSVSVLCGSVAFAGNAGVELGLQTSGDTSMFYQALITTGVINELNEQTHYTVFAPTNAAFSEIQPRQYPCFYSEQCRPQIAALLRNHILQGRHDLKELATYGQGVQSMGTARDHVVQTFAGHYAVNDMSILTKSDVSGNIVYRINGVLASPQELSQFQTVNAATPETPLGTTTITTESTTTQRLYPAPRDTNYPGGSMVPDSHSAPPVMSSPPQPPYAPQTQYVEPR